MNLSRDKESMPTMLQNFQFARYRFNYTVQEPLRMPPYKGNVFRSQLGYTLRHITCIGNGNACAKQCQYPDRCVYSQCFETPVPDDAPFLRGQPFAPHPFVLEPPLTGKQHYAPGDVFACQLILIGSAINLLPWMAFTFNELGKRRIGLRGQRGKCHLDTIESLPARSTDTPQTIYTSETEMLMGAGRLLCIDDVLRGAPQITDTLELDFRTPTSIKVEGRWMQDVTFELLIRNLLRRIRFLSYFHCGEDLGVDAHALIAAAHGVTHTSRLQWVRKERRSFRTERVVPMSGFVGVDAHALIAAAHGVTHTSRLQWVRKERRSFRTERVVPMSGFVGKVRFVGELAPFLPLIFLGEYLHIGHHTAFGFGKYRIDVSAQH